MTTGNYVADGPGLKVISGRGIRAQMLGWGSRNSATNRSCISKTVIFRISIVSNNSIGKEGTPDPDHWFLLRSASDLRLPWKLKFTTQTRHSPQILTLQFAKRSRNSRGRRERRVWPPVLLRRGNARCMKWDDVASRDEVFVHYRAVAHGSARQTPDRLR